LVAFVVVAEKPSIARRIRAALGGDIIVLSVRGHVTGSDLPKGFWEWRLDSLHGIFRVRRFREVVRDPHVHRQLLNSFKKNRGARLVIATDNDSEGELIGAEILSIWVRVNGGGGVLRMRLGSVDLEEIRRAWRGLERGLNWRWVEKARFRERFDLATGAAFTRALTLASKRYSRGIKLISWGSCQTPTLWLVVQRERERMAFKPQPFWVIKAVLETGRGERFEAEGRRFERREVAERLFREARDSEAVVKRYSEKESRVLRPLPIRTDDMLRDLTRITGATAAKLLQVAENLYAEGHISYPRTDTNVYRSGFDFSKPLEKARKGLGMEIRRPPSPRQGNRDDGAHTPIYPLSPPPSRTGLEWSVWEYVARRFLANAYYGDAARVEQRAVILLGPVELTASGSKTMDLGFLTVYPYFRPSDKPLPEMRAGDNLRVVEIWLHQGMTSPPERLSEADLLRLMEEHGIGTDATRASFPKLIIDRGYAIKRGEAIIPTRLGMSLIEALEMVEGSLATTDTRRRVEEYMDLIEKGAISYSEAIEKSLTIYEQLFTRLEKRIWEVGKIIADGARTTVSGKKGVRGYSE